MTATKKIPRGIRNNNPLNIRISKNQWLGKRAHNTDGAFEQFDTMLHGIRAGFVTLRSYMRKYNLHTIAKIISRWAPTNENNTVAYIKAVSQRSEIDAGRELYFLDKEEMVNIIEAMIYVECGVAVSKEVIEEAYNMV